MVVINISGTGPRPRKLQQDTSKLEDLQEDLEDHQSTWNSIMGATKLAAGLIEGASNEKIKEVETRVKAGLSTVSNAVIDDSTSEASEAGRGDGTFADVVFDPEKFQKQTDALFPKTEEYKWFEGAAKKAAERARTDLSTALKTDWEETAKIAFDNARLQRGVNVDIAENDTRTDVVNKMLTAYPEFLASLQTQAGKDKARTWLTEAVGQQVTQLIRNPQELVENPSQLESLFKQWEASGANDINIDLARRSAVQNLTSYASTTAGQAQIVGVLSDLVDPGNPSADTQDYEGELEKLGIKTEAISSLKNSAYGQYVVDLIEDGTPIAEARIALELSHGYVPGASELAGFIKMPQVSLDTSAEALLRVIEKYSDDGIFWISRTEWSRVGHWFSLQSNADAWNRLTQTPVIMEIDTGGNASVWGGPGGGSTAGAGGSAVELTDAFLAGFNGTTADSAYSADEVKQGANAKAKVKELLEASGITLGDLTPGRRVELYRQILSGKLFGRIDASKNMEEISASLGLGIKNSGIMATKGGGDWYLDPLNVNGRMSQAQLHSVFGSTGDGVVFAAVTEVHGDSVYELRAAGGERGEASLPIDVKNIGFEKLTALLGQTKQERPPLVMPEEGHIHDAVERGLRLEQGGEPIVPLTEEQAAATRVVEEGIEEGKALIFTDTADPVIATAAAGYAMYRLNKTANGAVTSLIGARGADTVAHLMSRMDYEPIRGARTSGGQFARHLTGESQRTLTLIEEALGVPASERVRIDQFSSTRSDQRARYKRTLTRYIREAGGPEAFRQALKQVEFDKGARIALTRLGGKLKRATGGMVGLVIFAGDMLAFGLSTDESIEAIRESHIRSGVAGAFDKINKYGFFELSAGMVEGSAFNYTPAPDNAGYIGTALHYVGQWSMGMFGELSTGKGAAGMVRSVVRSATNLFGEYELAFGFSVGELAGQKGGAFLQGLATRGRAADQLPAWVASDDNHLNSMVQTAVDLGIIRDYNTALSFLDLDNRAYFKEALQPSYTGMRALERQSRLVKLDDPSESRALQGLIAESGFGGDFQDRYLTLNDSFLNVLDPKYEKEGEIPRMQVRGDVFWSNRAGAGHFNPEAGHTLVANSDMGGLIGFLETVSADQNNIRYSPQDVEVARKFLLDRDDIPHSAHRLINTVQDFTRDQPLNALDADAILSGWHEFTLPGGDPLEFADDWYDHALASNKNMPEGMVEQFADTVKDFLDWARSNPNIKESLPSMDIEGLSDRQKLTIDILSWISIGAPTAHSGEPQRNKRLSDFFPTTAEDILTGESFFNATGIYIDTTSMTYGYEIELSHDTPEFMIHLRDEGLVPKTLNEYTTEYGLFASRLPRTIRSRAGDFGKTTREYMRDTMGIDTRNVGRVAYINPSLTGPDKPGEVQEYRIRPYTTEEMGVFTDRVLRYELSIMANGDNLWNFLDQQDIPSLPFTKIQGSMRRKVGGQKVWTVDLGEGDGRGLTGEEVIEAAGATTISMTQGVADWNKQMSAPLNLPKLLTDLSDFQFRIVEDMERNNLRRTAGEINEQRWYLKNKRFENQNVILDRMARLIETHGYYLEQIDGLPSAGIFGADWERHSRIVEQKLRAISD
jgi:hypothetical protein